MRLELRFWQSQDGSIWMICNNNIEKLTYQQVCNLHIKRSAVAGFDYELFKSYYAI